MYFIIHFISFPYDYNSFFNLFSSLFHFGVLAFFIFLFKNDIKSGWINLLLESRLGPFLKKKKLLNEAKVSDYYEPRSRNESQMDEM